MAMKIARPNEADATERFNLSAALRGAIGAHPEYGPAVLVAEVKRPNPVQEIKEKTTLATANAQKWKIGGGATSAHVNRVTAALLAAFP